MQVIYNETEYTEFNNYNEYVPSHPTLSWKKIILDFSKNVIYPALIFLFILFASGKNRTISEFDLKWLWEYILLCTFYCNFFRILSLVIYLLSPVTFLINLLMVFMGAVPITIWRFIKMNFYMVLTIIRVIRLLYFKYKIKNM